jgi:hypothetical protein
VGEKCFVHSHKTQLECYRGGLKFQPASTYRHEDIYRFPTKRTASISSYFILKTTNLNTENVIDYRSKSLYINISFNLDNIKLHEM